ncbi:MAG: hypothetical protein Q8O67_33235 [Deltaproteobacteria bacterium]|nr:hypothetical protein [Deltaproteobacteria bacterium]
MSEPDWTALARDADPMTPHVRLEGGDEQPLVVSPGDVLDEGFIARAVGVGRAEQAGRDGSFQTLSLVLHGAGVEISFPWHTSLSEIDSLLDDLMYGGDGSVFSESECLHTQEYDRLDNDDEGWEVTIAAHGKRFFFRERKANQRLATADLVWVSCDQVAMNIEAAKLRKIVTELMAKVVAKLGGG